MTALLYLGAMLTLTALCPSTPRWLPVIGTLLVGTVTLRRLDRSP